MADASQQGWWFGARTRRAAQLVAIAAAALMQGALGDAASKNFVPDVVFKGSSLTGWRVLGQADWRATDGEIQGTPKAGGGWLILDRSYQDVGVFASFRCAAGGKAGVLLRAEQTADGGMKGVFVSLTEGDLVSYRVTLDAQGTETSRERLRPAGGGRRMALPPPPPPAGAAAARAGRRRARRWSLRRSRCQAVPQRRSRDLKRRSCRRPEHDRDHPGREHSPAVSER